MGRVVIRPQHGAETLTGGVLHGAQEPAWGIFIVGCRPVARQPNVTAIRQREASDIQRIRGGVFTAACVLSSVDVAAGVAAHMGHMRTLLMRLQPLSLGRSGRKVTRCGTSRSRNARQAAGFSFKRESFQPVTMPGGSSNCSGAHGR